MGRTEKAEASPESATMAGYPARIPPWPRPPTSPLMLMTLELAGVVQSWFDLSFAPLNQLI